MNVLEELKNIESKYNVKVLYCTYSGSKLYGTNSENSDTDYKFIFTPAKEDVLLKKDIEHIKVGAQTNVKNGKDDIDFDGYSTYKFFNLLKKSETGAVDLLFSMFREDTIVFQDEQFTSVVKSSKDDFLNRNMKSFIGYALGQSKKFGIKGARYDELDSFIKDLYIWTEKRLSSKVDDGNNSWEHLKSWVNNSNYKYIKFVTAPGPRGCGKYEDIEYLSVLGKLFDGTVSNEYLFDRVSKLHSQFGNRTKTVANTEEKVDRKALSHSLRIALEVEELILTRFIKFPLINADLVKDVKFGVTSVEESITMVDDTLAKVDVLLENSDLPENSNVELMNTITLKFLF